MKILIAVPTFENIYPDTFKSIYDLDKGENEAIFDFVRGYDCATARNRIAQHSLDIKADYVLMIDNDVVLPKNAITYFTEDIKEVCLGFYPHRGNDNIYNGRTCVCKLKNDRGKKYFNYPLESEYTSDELKHFREQGEYKIEIHGGGMGCAFINTSVFRKLKYPWYDWVNYADDHRGMLSEDLYFCVACRKSGFPIYTDTRISCGHLLRHIQYAE